MIINACGVIQPSLTFWGPRTGWPLVFPGAPLARIVNMHKHICTLTTGQKTNKQRRHCCSARWIKKLILFLWSTLSITDNVLCLFPFLSTYSFHFPLLVHWYFLIHFSFLFLVWLLQWRVMYWSHSKSLPVRRGFAWVQSIEASFLFWQSSA